MTTISETPTRTDLADRNAEVKEAQALARVGHADAEARWRDILARWPDAWAAAAGLVSLLDGGGRRTEAEAALRAFVGTAPTHAHVLAAARQWSAWQDTPPPGARILRVALTGTGTLAPLAAHLRVACAQIGLHPALYVGEFGQWAQDLLPAGSALYEFAPDLIAVPLEAAALFPQAAAGAEVSDDEFEAELTGGIGQLRALLAAAGRHAPAAAVLLHTFALPDYAPLGALDLKAPAGQRRRFGEINDALIALVRDEFPRALLLDQERAEARHGKARVRDDRLWYLASVPYSDSFLSVLAAEYIRLIRPLTGLTRKCVVLDLDNTLWGGVVGEDGFNGIKLGGKSAPGNAFHDFQLALDGLRRRGVLLAVCSKNNPDDVWPVLDGHPGMVLRRGHFAAHRIGWADKATGIAEIARELNIGLDSLVFLDDSPAERGLVRQRLPDVLTVEMPPDPALYTRTLLNLDVFETLSLTDEDRARGQQYQAQAERREFEASAGDLNAYLRGLEIVVTVAPATAFTVPRIAQLLNKTNQFNVTTRRHTEAQVQAMADDPDQWAVCAVSVADRFGDSGLTGVALAHRGPDAWELDSFLLSCRVLGRGVEDALLAHVLRRARAAGAGCLRAEFVPTAKNAPAAGFFAGRGFTEVGGPAGEGAASRWELALDGSAAEEFPDWLQVRCEGEGHP